MVCQKPFGGGTMQWAALLLGLAALGGLLLAGIRLSGVPRPPTWLALGHGAIAATGLGFLIFAVTSSTVPALAQISLAVLVLAALGGITIFAGFHLRGQALPIPLVLGHGIAAIVGYVLLLIAMYG
jgi:hypothetical protein